MTSKRKVSTCLWFDGQAEEAAAFYTSLLPDSRITSVRRLIGTLALDHLAPGGRLLVADVAFPTAREREAGRRRFADRWDRAEHYWAADETRASLRRLPLALSCTQVSRCGGVLVIRPAAR